MWRERLLFSTSVPPDSELQTSARMYSRLARCRLAALASRASARKENARHCHGGSLHGTVTAYGVMITHPRGATDAANRPLYAADAGEKFLNSRYDSFKADCRAASLTDSSLSVPVRPLLFETFGAVGRNVLDLMRHARRHFSAQYLDIDYPSAESFFHTTWAYRISVANMRGTAEIIYRVPRGETVPARFKRPTKEDHDRLGTARGRRPFRGRPRGSRHPTHPVVPRACSSGSDSDSDSGSDSRGFPTRK